MLTHEAAGWLGEWDIVITCKDGTVERQKVKNRLTNAALNLFRDGLLGVASDFDIKYMALGTSNAAINDADTVLGAEGFRCAHVNTLTPSDGVARHTFIVQDNEAVINIREIGIFATAAATATADTGVMLSRILWSRNKTNLESIQFIRTDSIRRG